MREILFRAKTEPNCKDVATGKIVKKPKWIYGYVDLGYMRDCKSAVISDEKGNTAYRCQCETIGQYTGLTDKNGKRIFEGDIVVYDNSPYNAYCIPRTGEIVWRKWAWRLKYVEHGSTYYYALGAEDFFGPKSEVIGNIHDNPELLEGGATE